MIHHIVTGTLRVVFLSSNKLGDIFSCRFYIHDIKSVGTDYFSHYCISSCRIHPRFNRSQLFSSFKYEGEQPHIGPRGTPSRTTKRLFSECAAIFFDGNPGAWHASCMSPPFFGRLTVPFLMIFFIPWASIRTCGYIFLYVMNEVFL